MKSSLSNVASEEVDTTIAVNQLNQAVLHLREAIAILEPMDDQHDYVVLAQRYLEAINKMKLNHILYFQQYPTNRKVILSQTRHAIESEVNAGEGGEENAVGARHLVPAA